jgi:hypothetical protein
MSKIMSKKDLMIAFNKNATAMVDVEHLYKTIKDDLMTDIKKGDFVISTTLYDSSVFVVDPLFKEKKRQRTTKVDGEKKTEYFVEKVELPNPYQEFVVDGTGRVALTVKADEETEGAVKEMRIKVKKLSLLSWDETNNSYPRQSQDIIFRQKNINFYEKYGSTLYYWKSVIANIGGHYKEEQIADAVSNVEVLTLICNIPPFLAYHDEKYGFLVKRELVVARIVLPAKKRVDAEKLVKQEIVKNVELMMEQAERKIGEADNLHEAICMEAFKPERTFMAVKRAGGWDKWNSQEVVVT